MSEELRECPFCGNKDVILSDYRLVGNATCWRITCLHCRLVMSGANKQLLLNLWNTRPAEDALKAENAKLKCTFEKMKTFLVIIRDHAIQSCRQDGKAYHPLDEWMARFCNGLLGLINTDTEKGEKSNE